MKVTVNTENTEYDCELEDLLWGKGFNTYRNIFSRRINMPSWKGF